MRIQPVLAATLMLLASCTPPQDTGDPAGGADGGPQGGNAGSAPDGGSEGSASDSEAEAPAEPSANDLAMINTAWRVTGEDGAVYTTYFDPEGRYRDTKNGEPWHEGAWERLADGRLCFTPDDQDRSGACWALGERKADGTMRARRDDGREIELQQVTYLAPAAAEG